MSALPTAEATAEGYNRLAYRIACLDLIVLLGVGVLVARADAGIRAEWATWLVPSGILVVGVGWLAILLLRAEAARLRRSAEREAVLRAKWATDAARWEAESRDARERYAAQVAEVEALLRSATDLLPPAVDPDAVTERLRDLDLDVSTKIAPDGAVTVTLRKKPEPATAG